MLQENLRVTSITQEGYDQRDLAKAPLVSVVIPARNSGDTIASCLSSVTLQSYKPIEIIVVDRFSTDLTKIIAKNMGALVISHDSERSAAKNLGAKLANGQYLYFMDADHKLGPDVISACVKMIDPVDAVLINDQDIGGDSNTARLVASRRRLLSYDPLNIALRFVRRAAFDRLGGFDSDLIAGEDLDLHRRFLLNGFKLAYSRATVWHLGSPVYLNGLLKRNNYYSSNYLRYASKNPLISLKRLNPLRVVTAWKRSDSRGSDLLPVVLLGFLSNAFLIAGLLLNLNAGKGTRQETHDHCKSDYDRNSENYDRVRFGTPGSQYVDKEEQEFVASIISGFEGLGAGTVTGRFVFSLTHRGPSQTTYEGYYPSRILDRQNSL
jgi:glycosyltransferase involved in cell wall biosynthesis